MIRITGAALGRIIMAASLALGALFSPLAPAQEPIRLAFIDPQSGSFAATGNSAYQVLRFAADYYYNRRGGVLGGRPLEVVALDNKAAVADSQLQLRRAISEGMQYVISGQSSAVASALATGIERHNDRNPNARVLLLNYAAVDPLLTEDACSFWHFRFDAHADMKMTVMADHIAANPAIRRVYVIGQDYSFGQAVGAAAARLLPARRADLQLVGNELHPIGQVKDFTPYISKIVASEANAVVTGNWGADMVALARGIADAGLDLPVYTFYAAYDGITGTLGAAGRNRIHLVHNDHANPFPSDERRDFTRAFETAHPELNVTQPRLVNTLMMLVQAMAAAGSSDPLAVALALEDSRLTTMTGEQIWMRPQDHQLFAPLHVSVHTDEDIEFDLDRSGYGLRTVHTAPLEATLTPSSCQMQRPAP